MCSVMTYDKIFSFRYVLEVGKMGIDRKSYLVKIGFRFKCDIFEKKYIEKEIRA